MILHKVFSRMVPLLLVATMALVSTAHADDEGEEGFVSLFNGKDLTGWEGDATFWSVRDGVITAESTAEKTVRRNTFLIWTGGEVEDFELRLKFRALGGNSGIQFRSQDKGNHVIHGYQADFDAPNAWSGTLYDEGGRGVLAKRGTKVEVSAEGKPKVVGETTPAEKIVASMKKDGFNDYTIIARGNHLILKINGHVTVDLVDHDTTAAEMIGKLALQLHAGPPMKVQFKDIRIKTFPQKMSSTGGDKVKKICFVAGKKSHGFGAHEHRAGCLLLAKHLNASELPVEAVVHENGWPEDASFFDGADAVVMYCDGGPHHYANEHLAQINEMASRGVGIVAVHYGVEVPKSPGGERFLNWIGGYFEAHWSVNPHWDAKYEALPTHPITRGVEPFELRDEWYYHMRFRPEMQGVTPILSALPPKETLDRPDSSHGGNPAVRAEVGRGELQHTAWAAERDGGGRGFGLTGGHFHWNWGHNEFRQMMLNAMWWVAGGDVPAAGIDPGTVTADDLLENQDYEPRNFNRADLEASLVRWNGDAK